MFEDGNRMNSVYVLDIILRPNGKCDLGYLSGLADCLGATLKVKFGAISRKFSKTPQGFLIIQLQMNTDDCSEEDTAQFIVDMIDASSMKQDDCELFIDNKRLTLVVEK